MPALTTLWGQSGADMLNSNLSGFGRYCCKSPKLPGANFSAVKKSDRRPPIDGASITLPGSPASFSSDDEVPHIFTWKSPVQPKEILIASAKRLLQQNLPVADLGCPKGVYRAGTPNWGVGRTGNRSVSIRRRRCSLPPRSDRM